MNPAREEPALCCATLPPGWREEERTWYPGLRWAGSHLWWAVRALRWALGPETSTRIILLALCWWPRIRYHVLVRNS